MPIVEKEIFSDLVKNPARLNPEIIAQLEETTKTFPFFQIAYSLLAKASAVNGTIDTDQSKPKAAAYALSRVALQQLVENDVNRFDASELTPVISASVIEEVQPLDGEELLLDAEPDDMLAAISQKSEEQKIQQKIIEGFIKKNPRIIRQDNAIEPAKIDLKGRLAESGKGDIETEAFAKILVKQGKIEKAIDLYQKLILKNPEKRIYFAKILSDLNK